MSGKTPALSIGLAVQNGKDVVGRCIESVLSQDFTDFELLVRDNVSDDGTIAMLEGYARSDPRIALSVNDVNVGSHENMRLVLQDARGGFFRWISADDWLEPGCLSGCVRAFQSRPDAIGVTTWFTIHTPDGSARYEEYRGEFPTSPDPARRFVRMLWFFHAGDAKYDPVYGMHRRGELARARPLRPSERNDWLLSAELALLPDPQHREATRKSHARLPRRNRPGSVQGPARPSACRAAENLAAPPLSRAAGSRGDGGPHGRAPAPPAGAFGASGSKKSPASRAQRVGPAASN